MRIGAVADAAAVPPRRGPAGYREYEDSTLNRLVAVVGGGLL